MGRKLGIKPNFGNMSILSSFSSEMLFYRKDIGTSLLLKKRVDHMNSLLQFKDQGNCSDRPSSVNPTLSSA